MHAADFNDRTAGCRLPNLCRALEQRRDHGTSWSVAEVIGQVSGRPLAEYVVEVCAAQGVEAQVDRVELKHLPAVSDVEGREGERGALLGDNGMLILTAPRGLVWGTKMLIVGAADRP